MLVYIKKQLILPLYNNVFASCSDDGTIYIISVDDNKYEVLNCFKEKMEINSILGINSRNYLISVANNRITIWNIKTKQIVSIIDNITIIEKVATFQIDENKIILGCSQHLYVINIEMCRVHEIY